MCKRLYFYTVDVEIIGHFCLGHCNGNLYMLQSIYNMSKEKDKGLGGITWQ